MTHVNPKSEAAKYDYAIIAGPRDNLFTYQPVPIKYISEATQALVTDIEKGLVKN